MGPENGGYRNETESFIYYHYHDKTANIANPWHQHRNQSNLSLLYSQGFIYSLYAYMMPLLCGVWSFMDCV